MLLTQNKKWIFTCNVVVILSFLYASIANVVLAAPSRGDNEEQLRRARQQEQERLERQQQRDIFLQSQPKTEKDYELPKESPAFFIKAVKVDGKQLDKFPWLTELAARYNGRAIGQQGVNLIVKRLNGMLIAKGYITSRVVVPEQDLTKGILHLILIPGIISDIRFEKEVERADWSMAFPTKPGNILNLRDIEQGLEQLKRIPSQDAEFKLIPGHKTGESEVVIALKRTKPWKIIYSVDDAGTKATGRMQGAITFAIDNFLGINDLFNLSFNRDVEGKRSFYGTNGNSSYWSFPSGYWTHTISASKSDYKQTLSYAGDSLVSRGDSQNLQFKSEYLIQRNKDSKTKLFFSVQQRLSHSYINDTEIMVQRRKASALEIGLSYRKYVNKDIWDYQLSYRHGTPWFGAQAQADTDNTEPTTRYGIWTGEINLVKPFRFIDKTARYTLILRGQYTNSTLYSSDGFSIGNRYTVRGFDGENTLIGERGFYCQNEIAIPIDAKGTEFYSAVDYGMVSGPSTSYAVGRQLIGAAAGFRGRLLQGNYEVFVGWPLKEPQNFNSGNPTMGFQLSYAL